MEKMKKSKFTAKTFTSSTSTSYSNKQRSYYCPHTSYRPQERRDFRKSYQPFIKRPGQQKGRYTPTQRGKQVRAPNSDPEIQDSPSHHPHLSLHHLCSPSQNIQEVDHPTYTINQSVQLANNIRLASHAQAWCHITSDRWVLKIVASGYAIEFKTCPLFRGLIFMRSPPALLLEVKELLRKKAIVPVRWANRREGFYFRYFQIPKRDGGIRPIMDLRHLNKFVQVKRYQLTTLQDILPLLHREWWLVMLDLKDAYLHIGIRLSHQKYLRFTIGTSIYQYQVLPFGLCTAPSVFTKCMAVAVAHLRTKGLKLFPCLDDWLLTSRDKKELLLQIQYMLDLL
ncbi:uncharacterized protein LOC128326962 [Hemicordylus capensis]|uniref:uncharacterized protein LOC128326962 n=1 Tax=Hemicordylus capensis TaxID=884348 RepID=UPI0023029E02|nr:uncharacterized protein LOC128326962 [Hemicordylus capensis]